MADTTFVDQQTVIAASWLNDVNVAVYRGDVKATVAPNTAGLYSNGTSLSFGVGGSRVGYVNSTQWGFDLPLRLLGEYVECPNPSRVGHSATSDIFTGLGATVAHYGMSFGVATSTLDTSNVSTHFAGYGGMAFYTQGTLRGYFKFAGGLVITAPTSGAAFTSVGATGDFAASLQGTDNSLRLINAAGLRYATLWWQSNIFKIEADSSQNLAFAVGGAVRLTIDTNGQAILATPASGHHYISGSPVTGNVLQVIGADRTFQIVQGGSNGAGAGTLSFVDAFRSATVGYFKNAGGFVVPAAASGTTLDVGGSAAFTGPIMPGKDDGTVQSTALIYAGSGAPSNANGANGSYYFRSDTPGTSNQRIYVKASGSWTGIV